LIVSQHLKKTLHPGRREIEAQEAQVSVHHALKVGEAPAEALSIACGKEGGGKATSAPEGLELTGVRNELLGGEGRQFESDDPAGEALRTLAAKVGGGRSQKEIPARSSVLVDDDPQDREEIRHPLRLVDHDQMAARSAKSAQRVLQRQPVAGVLEIVERGLAPQRERPSKRRLAGLSGTHERHHGKLAECRLDRPKLPPSNHPCIFSVLWRIYKFSFSLRRRTEAPEAGPGLPGETGNR
jgi:hypothetical protein